MWLREILKILEGDCSIGDEIRYDVEFAAATETVELGQMTIEKGCATGMRQCWSGIFDGRPLIELPIVWTLGDSMEPRWPVENGYVIEIEGLPSVRSRIEILHPENENRPDFGMNTALPAVHAIPHVCAAPPGIILAHELPLLTARRMTFALLGVCDSMALSRAGDHVASLYVGASDVLCKV